MWILPILSQELHKVCTLMHCKTNNVFLRMSAYNAHTRMQARTHARMCVHAHTHTHILMVIITIVITTSSLRKHPNPYAHHIYQ